MATFKQRFLTLQTWCTSGINCHETTIWGPISVGYAAGFLPLYWLVMREIISNIIGHNAATSPAHPVSQGIPRLRRAMDWSGIRSAAPECRVLCIEKSHLS